MATDEREAEQPRRRINPFELFILGELMEGPHHGYLLRDILSRLLGPYRQFSWGTLYPLISQLERSGYIHPIYQDEAERGESAQGGRQKRVLDITDAGRERFQALMLAESEYSADFPELFAIKLLYLSWLAPAEQIAVLAHGRDYYIHIRDHCLEAFTSRSPSAHLPLEAREAIYRVVHFRLAGAQAELAWIEGEIVRRRIEHQGDVS